MLIYAATIPLSTRSLVYLSGLLAAHRHEIGSRWRRLTAGEQALLVLARLRNGDTYTRLAAGFQVGVATVHRYVRGGGRPAGCGRAEPERGDGHGPGEGVRDPRWHVDPDRPDRRQQRPPVLLQ